MQDLKDVASHFSFGENWASYAESIGDPGEDCEVAPDLMQQSLDYVRHVRRSFAKSWRGVAAEDLAIAGFFLVARKHAVGERTGQPAA